MKDLRKIKAGMIISHTRIYPPYSREVTSEDLLAIVIDVLPNSFSYRDLTEKDMGIKWISFEDAEQDNWKISTDRESHVKLEEFRFWKYFRK